MKIASILLIFLSSTFTTFGQIGDAYSSPKFNLIGEVESLRRFIRLEQRNIDEVKSLYKFSFSDVEYVHLDYVGEVLFTASKEELLLFKSYLLKGFEIADGEDISFKLGKSDVIIKRFLSRTIVMSVYIDGGIDKRSTYIKPRDIPLIFNEN